MNFDKIIILCLTLFIIFQSLFIMNIKTTEIDCKEVVVVDHYNTSYYHHYNNSVNHIEKIIHSPLQNITRG